MCITSYKTNCADVDFLSWYMYFKIVLFQFLYCSATKEVVYAVQDLHNVGTFCQIVELQDVGERLRMILMGHRRIRMIGQYVMEENEDVEPEIPVEKQTKVNSVEVNRNGSRKRRKGDKLYGSPFTIQDF